MVAFRFLNQEKTMSHKKFVPASSIMIMAFAVVSYQLAAADPGGAGSTTASAPTQESTGESPKATTTAPATQGVSRIVGKPIDSGFVFIDGQYIDAPYIVTRDDGKIYINDRLVDQIIAPLYEKPIPDADPVMPSSINKNTSNYDKVLEDYLGKKIRYVQAHHTLDEEREIMEKVYRSLPFVKEAAIDPATGSLRIVTYSGETDSILLATPRRKGIVGIKAIREHADSKKNDFEKNLIEGSTLFLFTRGGHAGLDKEGTINALPKIVQILRSKKSVNDKIQELHKAGVTWIDKNTFTNLITNFSASDQLEKRLANMPAKKPDRQ